MKKLIILLLFLLVWGTLVRPPVSGGKLTSWYGIRFAHNRTFHPGTDIALPTGAPINPVSWGTVRRIGYDERHGNYVFISHLRGIESRYSHLDTVTVEEGQKVSPSAIIGTVGNTGLSSGSHLHYEKRVWGVPLPPYFLGLPGLLLQKTGIHKIVDTLIEKQSKIPSQSS